MRHYDVWDALVTSDVQPYVRMAGTSDVYQRLIDSSRVHWCRRYFQHHHNNRFVNSGFVTVCYFPQMLSDNFPITGQCYGLKRLWWPNLAHYKADTDSFGATSAHFRFQNITRHVCLKCLLEILCAGGLVSMHRWSRGDICGLQIRGGYGRSESC